MTTPCLLLLGGLPATGKSTIAAELLASTGRFAYVRIDTIEQALRDSGEMGPGGVQAAGYVVGHAVAADLLRSGHDVLVECVNPLALTRDAWRNVAETQRARLLEVELHCSDPDVHRARAENRTVDVAGLRLPSWEEIRTREYEAWETADLRIDTAATRPRQAAAIILDASRGEG